MTYEQAMAWWYGRIDYERRPPLPGDLKLGMIRALLRRLGDPQRRLRLVHVAGSKGKGSTSAMLAAVLRAAGHRTGLFTSPHLITVEERIQVDDVPITRDELAALLDEIREAAQGLNPTFFEVGTAAGFLHFVRRRCADAVIEVGLGGRFDSTNVLDPVLAVITSISYDHMAILGNTLDRIAFEKAGIVKPGRPTVSGVSHPEAESVIRRICTERRSPLIEIGRDFHFTYEPGLVGERPPRVTVRTDRTWPPMALGLLGAHQAANAAVAVACVERLRAAGFAISDAAVAEGLAGVRWPARLEVVGRRPWVVLDCAHNVASVQALVETLRESFPPGRRFLVFASSSDKDVPGMMRRMVGPFDHFYLTRFTRNARAVPPAALLEAVQAAGGTGTAFDDPVEAWRAAEEAAGPDDLIAVSGSVFLAGELRPVLVNHKAASG